MTPMEYYDHFVHLELIDYGKEYVNGLMGARQSLVSPYWMYGYRKQYANLISQHRKTGFEIRLGVRWV